MAASYLQIAANLNAGYPSTAGSTGGHYRAAPGEEPLDFEGSRGKGSQESMVQTGANSAKGRTVSTMIRESAKSSCKGRSLLPRIEASLASEEAEGPRVARRQTCGFLVET